jgi:carbon-monoxide dehydrogenase large subunit
MGKQEHKYIGKRFPKPDDWDRATGALTYGVEIEIPGMLYGEVARSEFPHAKVVHVDTEKARQVPGIKAVVTGKEFPFCHGQGIVDEPFLAIDKVRYYGEPIAAVAAVTPEAAREAVDLIKVEYQELPTVVDPIEAMKAGSPLVHSALETYKTSKKYHPVPGSNICNQFKLRRGDVDQGFAQADHVFEDTFTTQSMHPIPLEPHASVALVEMSGNLIVWSNTQAPHRVRGELAQALELPLNEVRVIRTELGGGFGGKLYPRVEPLAVALAFQIRGTPVKVVFSRKEVFMATVIRHPAIVKMKTGVLKNGKLVAREVTVVYDTGAYAVSPVAAKNGGVTAAGPYRIPNVKIDSFSVYTNNPVAGAVRGLGTPQVAWAYESQMDIIANELGLDPLQLRLMNCYEEGNVSATGEILHSCGLRETLLQATEAVGYREKQPQKSKGHGRGLASMFKLTNTPTSSAAMLMLNEDGSLGILSSSVEMGQGTETVLRQIVAEELGMPMSQMTVANPDTERTPYHAATSGSRTTFQLGKAIQIAAGDIKQQLIEMMIELRDVAPTSLEFRDGGAYVKGTSYGMTFSEIMQEFYGTSATILGRGFFTPPGAVPLDPETGQSTKPSAFWMYATQVAEVKVDRETGRVTVLNLASAHDVGKPINILGCEQQIEGAIVQGLGYALSEEIVTKQGITSNPSLAAYIIPTAMDLPSLIPILVEAPHDDGPYGAKGLGEPALTATAPAIANAIFNAVGVRIRDLPITAEKIWQALQEQSDNSSSEGEI